MDNETPKKGRKPILVNGRRRQVYMSDDDREFYKRLGNGNVSAGLRKAKELVERHVEA